MIVRLVMIDDNCVRCACVGCVPLFSPHICTEGRENRFRQIALTLHRTECSFHHPRHVPAVKTTTFAAIDSELVRELPFCLQRCNKVNGDLMKSHAPFSL